MRLHGILMHTVFLFDVDNTLLDNDRVTADLKRHLEQQVGLRSGSSATGNFLSSSEPSWAMSDYLGALQRYRIEYPAIPSLLTVSNVFW